MSSGWHGAQAQGCWGLSDARAAGEGWKPSGLTLPHRLLTIPSPSSHSH